MQGVRRTGNEGSDPGRLGQRCETGRGTCGLRWLLHLKFIFSFSFTKKFYWSVVDLQCCVGFRYVAEWISYTQCIWQMHSNEWCSKGLVCVSTIIVFYAVLPIKGCRTSGGRTHRRADLEPTPLCVLPMLHSQHTTNPVAGSLGHCPSCSWSQPLSICLHSLFRWEAQSAHCPVSLTLRGHRNLTSLLWNVSGIRSFLQPVS